MTKDIIDSPRDKAFHGSTAADEFWTTEFLTDKLFLRLAKIKESINHEGKKIRIKKYNRQAKELFKWIPIAKPSPAFIIYISDLTPELKSELEKLITSPESLMYVLTQAVGRVFENLDFEYYHLSIARNLRVRLEK